MKYKLVLLTLLNHGVKTYVTCIDLIVQDSLTRGSSCLVLDLLILKIRINISILQTDRLAIILSTARTIKN